jgi:hypothetical protein
MHPTVALSVVLLSWCLVRNRTRASRLLLAGVAILLGWEPAMGGNRSGTVLLLIATGFVVSLIWELVSERLDEARSRPRFAPAPAGAPMTPAPATATPSTAASTPASPPLLPTTRRIRLRRSRPRQATVAHPVPGVTHSTPPPPTAPPPSTWSPPPRPPEWSQAQQRRLAGEPLTDLERAEAYGDLLEANLEGLVDAYRSGDVRAQAAFAGEIAGVAQHMETALRVVVGERYRVQVGDTHPPGGPVGPTGPSGPA